MQKKLITLAVIAAAFSAPAFADTSVYGLIDAGYGSVDNTPTSTAGVGGAKTGESGVAFSQFQTSKVGVKSTESIGNGMTAGYQLEIGLSSNPQSAANFGTAGIATTNAGFTQNATISPDRVMAVSLDLGEGTTLIGGRVSSPLRNIAYGNDAMYGANFIGNLVTMDSSLTARANALAAVQNFGSVTATLAYLGTTRTEDNMVDNKLGNGFEITATYNQDALSVSGGYRDTEAVAGAATATSDVTTKDLLLAANYNFGVAKLYGQYATVQNDQSVAPTTSTKKTYETLGVNVPFTPAIAGYVETSFGKDNNGTDSANLSAYAVGVKYDFSKMTSAYADIGSAKLDNAATITGSKVDQIALGLVHSF